MYLSSHQQKGKCLKGSKTSPREVKELLDPRVPRCFLRGHQKLTNIISLISMLAPYQLVTECMVVPSTSSALEKINA